MTKAYPIKGLDCASCASKIEKKIAGLAGVKNVRVIFMTQKLTLEAEEEQMNSLLQQAARIVRQVEMDARLILPKT